MTAIQKLIGNILKNRIIEELKKEENQREFTSIQEIMDIFLAGAKITAEQYAEFIDLMATI